MPDYDITNQRCYLIAVRDFVVAQDIATTVRDLYPSADVLSVRSLEDADAVIAGIRPLSMAILDSRPSDLRDTRLGAVLAESEASILFLGDVPEYGSPVAARLVRFLPKPFDTARLIQALEGLGHAQMSPRPI